MGNTRALYACPKDFRYYEETTEEFIIPRGLRAQVEEKARGSGGVQASDRIQDDTRDIPKDFKAYGIELRPYQVGIPEEIIKHKEGIVRLGTGFGKSILALKVIDLLKQKALIIVPRTHIKAQFEVEIERYFGYKKADVQVGGHAPIHVSTLQALQRSPDKADGQAYGLVIVDECHTTVPQKSRQVIQSFSPKYLYGLTATPRRTDGQGAALGFLYGPILVDADLPQAKPTVELVAFKGHIPVWEYSDIIDSQIKNEERNALIASIVEREASAGRKVLVLTKRVEHYLHLRELLVGPDGDAAGLPSPSERIVAISSKGSVKDRSALLGALRSGTRDFSCLLGTFSLLSTGVDIPTLDTLIIAGDLKSDVLTEQSSGRVLRLFEGKPNPKIIDIQDHNNPILKRQAKEREKFYVQHGWQLSQTHNHPAV